MKNASIASGFLNESVDATDWVNEQDIKSVYLVLRHESTLLEPEITPFKSKEVGELNFFVSYDWLSSRLLDSVTGPWRIAATLMLALASFNDEVTGLVIPHLQPVGK